MRFFPEMKVRRDGVLEEVDDEVPEQDQKSGVAAAQGQTLRDHLNQGRCQHESRAQSDEVVEKATIPVLLDVDCASKHVGGCGGEPKHNADREEIHSCASSISERGFRVV